MRSPPDPAVALSTKRSLTRRGVLWVGLRCDVRCKFCYDENVKSADKEWISLDEAIRTLDKFRHYYQNCAVDFMGGEPTLHPRMVNIVKHAADIGLMPTIITHGMHLDKPARVQAYIEAGIHDFLVSIHGVGETVRTIHGRGQDNFGRQMRALDTLRDLGVPFRFNCTLVKDNLKDLESIAILAAEKGARVVNFLTFNPYFEWSARREIDFQARHSEIVPYLARALDKCRQVGVEANVRYMPICQLPGREFHAYTGFQLPYDTHEWDYNSWYDLGHAGIPTAQWYLTASRKQQRRHNYTHVTPCKTCAAREICDGFHTQYAERWGHDEARPYDGTPIVDPTHFIKQQSKLEYVGAGAHSSAEVSGQYAPALPGTQFKEDAGNRAGAKFGLPHTHGLTRHNPIGG